MEVIQENYEMFNLFFKNNIDLLKYYLGKVLDDYKYYRIDGLDSKNDKAFLKKAVKGCGITISKVIYYESEKYESLIDNADNEKHKIQIKYYNKLQDIIISISDNLDIHSNNELHNYDDMIIYIYYLLIKKFLIITQECGEYISWFNCIPLFSYNPVTEFQRIKNQQGLFIHQGYRVSHEAVYDCTVFTRQRIWIDKVFIIENKRKILKELDNIGINQKFVFYDFDSIAKYITSCK